MPIYLVDVALSGRIRVQANNEAEAEYLAKQVSGLGLSAGEYKIFEPKVTDAKVHGEMQNHTLQPINVKQKLGTKINGG